MKQHQNPKNHDLDQSAPGGDPNPAQTVSVALMSVALAFARGAAYAIIHQRDLVLPSAS